MLATKKVRFKKKRYLTVKKKEERKWKTQIRINHLASFFLDIFNLMESTN